MLYLSKEGSVMKEAISILLNYEPYLACLVQRCTRVYTDKVPTAAVRIMPAGVIELLINPEFFYNQSQEERVGLIWHEMYHLICDHINRSWGLDHKRANISMDEAINQLIPRELLPKRAILPEYFNHEKNKAFEFYYNLHLQRDDADKYQQPKAYQGGVDDKRKKNELQEQIKKALEKQKEISEKQKEQQAKQENTTATGSSSNVKETQKGMSKEQDSQEHNQETITEQLANNGMQDQAQQSDGIADQMKDLRKQMEDLQKSYPEKGGDNLAKAQSEMQKLQEEMKSAQQEIEEALNELDNLKKQQQQRESQKQQGQGGGEPQDGSGSGQEGDDGDTPHVIDNHDMWHTSPATKEDQKRSLTNTLVQAMHDTERQWGKKSIPAELRIMLEEAMKKPKVDWRKLIRNFAGRCFVNEQLYSRKKPSRKFGYLVPGKVQKFGPKVIIAIDCSGSVGNEEYVEFMAEFKGFTSHIAEKIEVVFFDTELSDKKLMIDSQFKEIPARPAMGGTDFQCVIDYANEQKPDLLVFLTDGAAPCPTKPRYNVLWGIVGGRVNPELKFGKQVLIELKDGKGKNSETYEAGA